MSQKHQKNDVVEILEGATHVDIFGLYYKKINFDYYRINNGGKTVMCFFIPHGIKPL